MDPVLKASALTKFYHSGGSRVLAVDGIDLEVQRGEFVALVGPSGSGKTTMLAMLAALLRPSQGIVTIDGVDLSQMGDAQRVQFRRTRIGFTFQANNLLPYLTVEENVALMLRMSATFSSTVR